MNQELTQNERIIEALTRYVKASDGILNLLQDPRTTAEQIGMLAGERMSAKLDAEALGYIWPE